MHFVYLIANEHQHIKIGHARDVRKRLQSLSCGSSSALEAVHVWERASPAAAMKLEAALHQTFAWTRRNGEWFDAPAYMIQAVGDALIATDAGRARELSELASHMVATHRWSVGCECEDDAEIADAAYEGYVRRACALGVTVAGWDAILLPRLTPSPA